MNNPAQNVSTRDIEIPPRRGRLAGQLAGKGECAISRGSVRPGHTGQAPDPCRWETAEKSTVIRDEKRERSAERPELLFERAAKYENRQNRSRGIFSPAENGISRLLRMVVSTFLVEFSEVVSG